MRIFALGGVAGPVWFTVVMLVCASIRPDYSHVSQFISDLGATNTANAAAMNYGAFLPAGVLLGVFGLSIALLLPRHILTTFASVLLMLFGTGIAACGLLSCDPGCPEAGGSLQNLIHNRIAPLSFMSAIVGAGLLAVRFRQSAESRTLWIYSGATSVTAFCLILLLVSSLEARDFTGLWQRLLIAALYLWCAVTGIHVYRFARPAAAV